MWTVVAVLAAWSVASLAVATLLGGVIALRRRDTALEAGRVHSLDGTDSRLAIPAFVS
jgi:hypothetical protein